MKIKKYLCC